MQGLLLCHCFLFQCPIKNFLCFMQGLLSLFSLSAPELTQVTATYQHNTSHQLNSLTVEWNHRNVWSVYTHRVMHALYSTVRFKFQNASVPHEDIATIVVLFCTVPMWTILTRNLKFIVQTKSQQSSIWLHSTRICSGINHLLWKHELIAVELLLSCCWNNPKDSRKKKISVGVYKHIFINYYCKFGGGNSSYL